MTHHLARQEEHTSAAAGADDEGSVEEEQPYAGADVESTLGAARAEIESRKPSAA